MRDEHFKEIVDIAKNNTHDFKLTKDVISEYGIKTKAEFFAEVFANSQLGIAMQEWLIKKGLIK